MRFGLVDAKVYAKEFTLKECALGEMEICIENGSIDIDIGHLVKDLRKSDREKVWELARKIVVSPDIGGMDYNEMEDCFETTSTFGVLRMPVDEALEKYESWKKKHDVETVIKSLKPQDVVAVPKPYGCGDYCVYMVTMVNPYAEDTCVIRGIEHTGDVILNRRKPEEYKGLEKIGRVVETTDILGEIKKIEDEWRKNR